MPLMQSATLDDDLEPPRGLVALDSVNADVRRAAVRNADAVADGSLLLARLDVEPDPGIRELIVDRLVATRDLDLAWPLLGRIRSDDIALRNAVIAALPRLGAALLPNLVPLLGDADPAVRIAAVNLLHGLPGAGAVDLALVTLADEPHINVCAALVDMLAEAGGADAKAPLQALVARFPDAPFIAFAVTAAIARIG